MNTNFFDERANRFYENQFNIKNRINLFFKKFFVGTIMLWIFALFTVPIVSIYLKRFMDIKIFDFTMIIIAGTFYTVIFFGYTFYNFILTKRKRSKDDELNLINVKENKEEVYSYINNCIANNEILFRHKSYPKEMSQNEQANNEVILLPKYLLHCKLMVVDVIPIEDVLKVFIDERMYKKPKVTDFRNLYTEKYEEHVETKLPTVSIYCSYTKAIEIMCETKEEAENVSNEIKQHLPNHDSEETQNLYIASIFLNYPYVSNLIFDYPERVKIFYEEDVEIIRNKDSDIIDIKTKDGEVVSAKYVGELNLESINKLKEGYIDTKK